MRWHLCTASCSLLAPGLCGFAVLASASLSSKITSSCPCHGGGGHRGRCGGGGSGGGGGGGGGGSGDGCGGGSSQECGLS